jgi:hypothetical protein
VRRETAVALLFWFHERARWRRNFLQRGAFVWPPFPREDEFRDVRIELYERSTLNCRRCPGPRQHHAG